MDAFSDCQQDEKNLTILRNFSRELSGFMLLAGPNGTGKTFAAKKVMSASRIWDTDHLIFFTQAELNLKWQKQLADWKETNYLLEQLTRAKLLVLDDVGTRIPTDAFMDFLYAIVDMRYNRPVATILTTNLNSADMRTKFGDAFVSRVASGQVIKFEGRDRRFDKMNF